MPERRSSADEDAGAFDETVASELADPREASGHDSLTRAAVRAALFESAPPRLGKYRVVRELGRGGLGVVYLAEDPELGRNVAVKVLRERAQADSEGEANVAREGRALAALSHPNVVHVYEIGAHRDRRFVAMEYVPGQTLTAWLSAQPQSWEAIVERFMEAGRGLAAAHDAGLIHRDFKPDNVLVGEDDRARVLDFGLAQAPASDDAAAEHTRAETMVGTPAYMAPEQVLGTPLSPRSDQFSFCVALFEALFGRRPFDGDTVESLTRAIATAQVVDPPDDRDVPRPLEAIVRRGLSRNAEDRFESMPALLSALSAELERKPRARRARTIGAATIGSAIAAAVLVWTTTEREQEPSPPPAAMELRVLTRTPGEGIDAVAVSPDERRLAYTDRGGLWLRDVAGGVPQRLERPAPPVSAIAFGSDTSTLWATDADSLWRVDVAAGTADRLAHGVTPSSFLAVSPTGRVAGLSAEALWIRAADGAPMHSLPRSEHPAGLAWSPDERFVATRSWPRGSAHEVLRVTDIHGVLQAEAELEASGYEGLAWFQDDQLVALGGEQGELVARCIAFDPQTHEVGETRSSPPVANTPGMARGLGHTANGGILLSVTSTQRDVLVGTVGDEAIEDLERVTPDIDAENHHPTWLDNDRLAFVSLQHLYPALLTLRIADGELSPPAALDADISAFGSAGPEALLFAFTRADGSTALELRRDEQVKEVSDPSGGDPIESVRCHKDAWCGVLRGPAHRRRIDILDPRRAAMQRGADCPSDVLCLPGRLFPTADGRVLLVEASLRALAWFDPRSGSTAATSYVLPEHAIAQSAALWPESDDVIATLIFDSDTPGPQYAIARLRTDGSSSIVWRSNDRWVVGPTLSPDGSKIALTGLDLHSEAALLDNAAAQCR